MSSGPSVALIRDIQNLFDNGTASGLTDRQLLERFTGGQAGSAEAAFEMLVSRHGPMVLRVCRNVLGDSTDAQDAFQATFLVLVRRSRSIRRLESVGSWLYGVACRVAARARVEAARRRAAERHGALRVVTSDDPDEAAEFNGAEFGPLIQDEVQRLPEKYRAVVALCYWEGLTHEQAATQLGCPLGTVRSRMSRARDLLRRRLTRRGLAPLAEAIAPLIPPASVGRIPLVPQILIVETVKSGAQLLSGAAITSAASPAVATLAQGFLRSFLMIKVKIVAASLIVVGIGAYGASLAAPQGDAQKPVTRPGRSPIPVAEQKAKAQPAREAVAEYIVEPPDLLLVEVLESLPGRPISGERQVRPDGKISLGFYGDVYVAGLTLPEIKEKIIAHLRKYLSDEGLGLVAIDQNGNKIIDPNTKEQARLDPKDSAAVFVDLAKSNSKFFYVLGAVQVPGRLPITGNETVLDAINMAGGLTAEPKRATVVLCRPELAPGRTKTLVVDIDQIAFGGDPTTNYQLKPGDRLVVTALPKLEPAETNNTLTRITQPQRPVDSGSETSTPRVDRSPARSSVADRALLQDVQKRLKDVEQKLDLILEILKPQPR